MARKYDSLMDRYLRGESPPEEVAEVKRMMAEDEAFSAEIRFRQQTTVAIQQEEHRRLKGRLALLAGQSAPQRGQIRRNFSLLWYVAAAALVIAVAVSFLFWPIAGSETHDDLFAAYFSPYPNVVMPVLREATVTDRYAEAYARYEQGDYEMAYTLFDELEGHGDAAIAFYKGICAMQLGKMAAAVEIFKDYQTTGDARFVQQSQWYQALAHLKLKDDNAAVDLLNELAKSSGYKQEEAAALLSSYRSLSVPED